MKRNEYAEPTEMAGVAEAETEAAYAWALDYDSYDELPTVPTQRLTPRRITSLGLAASLTVIAAAGAVMLFVAHDANRPIAQAPSPHVETSASPSPLPPPPPPPRPPNPAAEARFVADV